MWNHLSEPYNLITANCNVSSEHTNAGGNFFFQIKEKVWLNWIAFFTFDNSNSNIFLQQWMRGQKCVHLYALYFPKVLPSQGLTWIMCSITWFPAKSTKQAARWSKSLLLWRSVRIPQHTSKGWAIFRSTTQVYASWYHFAIYCIFLSL